MRNFFNLTLFFVLLFLSENLDAQFNSRVVGTINVDGLPQIVNLTDLGPTWVPTELTSDTLQLRDLDLNVVAEIVIGATTGGCCNFSEDADVTIMPEAGRQTPEETEFIVSYVASDGTAYVEVYGVDGSLKFSSLNEPITASSFMILQPPLFDETSLLLGGTVNGVRHVSVYSLSSYDLVREREDCVAYAMPNFPNQPVALVGREDWTGLRPNLLFNGLNDLFAIANSYQEPFEQDWGLDGEFDFARVLQFGANDYQLEVQSSNSTIHVRDQVIGVTGSRFTTQYSNVLRPSSNNFPATLIRFDRTNGDRLDKYYNTATVRIVSGSTIEEFDQLVCVDDTEYLYETSTASRRILFDRDSGDSVRTFPFSIDFDTTQVFYNRFIGSCSGSELYDINYAYSGNYEGEQKIFLLNSQFEVDAYMPLNRLYRTFVTSDNRMFYYSYSNRDRGVVDVYEVLDRSVSVEDLSEGAIKKLRVFPNPANESFQVTLDQVQLSSAVLMDVTGRLVSRYSRTDLQGPISLSGLLPGLYFINAWSEDGKGYNERLCVSAK